MSNFDHRKYQPFPSIDNPSRQWPNKTITAAPMWCSVDLRDGNQALVNPMTPQQKWVLFELLVDLGFKQIEVGFPAASQPEFNFVRQLIEQEMIPEDVTIQVLTQAREELIERTFESLRGVKRAIVHVYNSTSKIQREHVFGKTKLEIRQLAEQGARWVRERAEQQPLTNWQFQYSPESFTATELEFAAEVCNAVIATWSSFLNASHGANPTIINLPATVEMAPPNVFADQIEWMCRTLKQRDKVIVSLHTHNDRGCAVAAAELGIMAGADRVEGTLLGNGERTGNMDIVTMAMNLYSQGLDPCLDLSQMNRIIEVVQRCTDISVHPRHPYAGALVFTAFSGSHQDAIHKCMTDVQQGEKWEVPYLPIDPRDVGRSYQEVVRINSQSGKGGIAHVLKRDFGIELSREMQIEFSRHVQRVSEEQQREVSAEELGQLFTMTSHAFR